MEGFSARAYGMAGAYTALVNDASAVWWNPGALGWLKRPEILTSYGRLHAGLSDGSGLAQSVIAGAVPVDEASAFGAGWSTFSLLDAYQEQVITVGYGRQWSPWLMGGATIKWLSKRFVEDAYTRADPLFARSGYAAGAVSGDVGALVSWGRHYTFGIALKDWLQPNLGLGESDRLPLRVNAGMAYRHAEGSAALEAEFEGADWRVRAGSEKWWGDRTFAVRGGLEWGSRELKTLSLGASYRSPTWQLDYAFAYPLGGLKGLAGTHRVSFGVRFGPASPEELETHDVLPLKTLEAEMALLLTRLGDMEARHREMTEHMKKLREEDRLGYDERVSHLVEEIGRLREQLREWESARPVRPTVQPVPEPRKPPVTEPPARPKTYLVKEGDTLMSVAEKIYGDASEWKKIYDANADRIERGILTPGQELILP